MLVSLLVTITPSVSFAQPMRSQDSADKWEAIDHQDQLGCSRDPQDLFNFRWNKDPKNNSTGCALTPSSNYGPYWHEGQPKRQDIRNGQRGIYLRLALQIINISCCNPLHGAQVDVWQATAMGDYSGEAGSYLRGWQPTSNQGTVEFDTIFPGHYQHRASHIHVAVRALWEKRVVSIGQIYFDQYLRDEGESTTQYKNNQRPLKSNHDDGFTFPTLRTSTTLLCAGLASARAWKMEVFLPGSRWVSIPPTGEYRRLQIRSAVPPTGISAEGLLDRIAI